MIEAFKRESYALMNSWLDPKFPDKFMAYLLSIN
jgi:hypothetical protein